jgi:F-type H+-transporting ATPase subunit b
VMTPTRRHRYLLLFLLALGLVSVPLPLSAAGGGGEHAMTLGDILWDLGIKVLNVGILGFLAFKYLSKPLNTYVESRSAKVQSEIDTARSAQREAEERLRIFQEKTSRVDAEIKELRGQTCADIDGEQKILLEEARAAAEHIRQHARDTIRQEVAKAREDLHREAARLSTDLAEEIIRKNVNDDDRKRLVDGYLREMEGAP